MIRALLAALRAGLTAGRRAALRRTRSTDDTPTTPGEPDALTEETSA